MTDAIATISIAIATWTVALTAFLVKIAMRLKSLEKDHDLCKERRVYQEDLFLERSQDIHNELVELKTDIKWIKKAIENGNGGNHEA